MKIEELKAIASRLSEFEYITKAYRVEDNAIELHLKLPKNSDTQNKTHTYIFDMTRGHSTIYKAPPQKPIQRYNAPFDALLFSMLSSGKLLGVSLHNNDRILLFKVAPKSSYKNQIVYLQLEFTGKYTNAILLDENNAVIEALKHIDSSSSFRVIRPGVTLADIPAKTQPQIGSDIQDIDTLLEQRYIELSNKKLQNLKKQKLYQIQKKIDKLQQELDRLPNEQSLKEEENRYKEYANIILANLYQIKHYDTKLKAYDFSGNEIVIKFPKDIKVNRLSDYFFNLSKRAKNKAKNIHIEKENLLSKKSFYENIAYALQNAKSPYELELLVPKRGKSQRKKAKLKDGELFWIDDYKVMVGRNSKENQKLLSLAKSNDIWMHIRDVPSSHVIIRTDKQNLPDSLIQAAARLCVDFSVKNPGDYEVDYTKRKFVKVQEGSNVLYNKYNTIKVTKEGVEIRI
jgi:predicted ribosome quality control (RQC) complex YloA/Tae2 family protein